LPGNGFDNAVAQFAVPLLVVGVRVFGKLRYPSTKDIPIIATTGMSQQSNIDACLKAGCNSYIIKPFSLAELGVKSNNSLKKRGHESAPNLGTSTGSTKDPGSSLKLAHIIISDPFSEAQQQKDRSFIGRLSLFNCRRCRCIFVRSFVILITMKDATSR
jgi:CheY-like chemotaxis protein